MKFLFDNFIQILVHYVSYFVQFVGDITDRSCSPTGAQGVKMSCVCAWVRACVCPWYSNAQEHSTVLRELERNWESVRDLKRDLKREQEKKSKSEGEVKKTKREHKRESKRERILWKRTKDKRLKRELEPCPSVQGGSCCIVSSVLFFCLVCWFSSCHQYY